MGIAVWVKTPDTLVNTKIACKCMFNQKQPKKNHLNAYVICPSTYELYTILYNYMTLLFAWVGVDSGTPNKKLNPVGYWYLIDRADELCSKAFETLMAASVLRNFGKKINLWHAQNWYPSKLQDSMASFCGPLCS